MQKKEMAVLCVYTDKGETVQEILFRSFALFLRRELRQDGSQETLPDPMD